MVNWRQKIVVYVPLLIVLALILVVYLKTMLPSQAFHDSGELQSVVPTINVAHTTGYPTYVLLGKVLITLMPIGEIAWKVNFLSVIYSLLTLFFISLIIFRLIKEYILSLIGVLTLAFVEPFWNYAGIANVHTLHRLIQFILIYIFILLFEKWSINKWYLFCLILGLGLGNHLLIIYMIPVFFLWLVYLLYKKRAKFFLIEIIYSGLLFLLGLSVYILLPVRQFFGPIHSTSYDLQTLSGFISHVSGSDFHSLMFQGGIWININNSIQAVKEMKDLISTPATLLTLIGIICFTFKNLKISLGLLFMSLLTLVFSANYPTSDHNRYYLSIISVYSIFVSLGVFAIYKLLISIFRIKSEFYQNIFAIFLASLFIIVPFYLYNKNYDRVDKSGDFSARDFAVHIFSDLEPNSVILSWWNYSTPLWYRQDVLGERKDLKIINEDEYKWASYAKDYIANRPVFMVSENLDVENKYRVDKTVNPFRVYEK